jgi:YD repeat-containing protein
LNRLASISYPVGNKTTISYGSASKLATRGGLSESTVYDGFGRERSINLGGITTSYGRDVLGRLNFSSNPGNSIGTSYQYDILDRVIGITNADNTNQVITYGVAAKAVKNERGHVQTYGYRIYGDPDQQYLTSVQAPDSAASMYLQRDGKDQITTITQNGLIRSYTYDSGGYLTSVVNPETGTTTYGRDAAGNMVSSSVGSSGATVYGYDSQNRLISTTYPGGTPAVSRTYSGTHKLTSVSSLNATRIYDYDSNDNLSSASLTVDNLEFRTGYSYNGNDQLSTVTYPRSGRVVSYAPDALGRPTQASGFVSSVAYWPSGQISQINYANGTNSSYGQNSRLWPSSFATSKNTLSYLNSNYGYDGSGNLTSIADAADSSRNRTLGYDVLHRLNNASGPWGTGSLNYDGTGNITKQVLGATILDYSYSNNRLASVSGARTASYAYDVYGDIVTAGNQTYSYDAAPNLICANCGTSNSAQYKYDGMNQRVSVFKNGVKTYEIYGFDGRLLTEFTPGVNSNRQVDHIYLAGQRVAQIEPAPTSMSTPVTTTLITGRATSVGVTISGKSPTGTLYFYEGTTLLGQVQLVGGSGSLPMTLSTLGKHTITIVYSGDASNASSTQTVELTVLTPFEHLLPIFNWLKNEPSP